VCPPPVPASGSRLPAGRVYHPVGPRSPVPRGFVLEIRYRYTLFWKVAEVIGISVVGEKIKEEVYKTELNEKIEKHGKSTEAMKKKKNGKKSEIYLKGGKKKANRCARRSNRPAFKSLMGKNHF
jgi:hypothetical protein